MLQVFLLNFLEAEMIPIAFFVLFPMALKRFLSQTFSLGWTQELRDRGQSAKPKVKGQGTTRQKNLLRTAA